MMVPRDATKGVQWITRKRKITAKQANHALKETLPAMGFGRRVLLIFDDTDAPLWWRDLEGIRTFQPLKLSPEDGHSTGVSKGRASSTSTPRKLRYVIITSRTAVVRVLWGTWFEVENGKEPILGSTCRELHIFNGTFAIRLVLWKENPQRNGLGFSFSGAHVLGGNRIRTKADPIGRRGTITLVEYEAGKGDEAMPHKWLTGDDMQFEQVAHVSASLRVPTLWVPLKGNPRPASLGFGS